MKLDRTIKAIIMRTAILAAFLSISYWILCPGGLLEQLFSIDLSFLFLPIAVFSAMHYLSKVNDLILASEISKVLGITINRLGIITALYLLAKNWASDIWSATLFWMFVIALIAVSGHTIISLAKIFNETLLVIFLKAISFFLVGMAFSTLLNSLSYSPLKALSEVVLWTFIVAAIISLLPLFSFSSNLYLRFIATKLGSKVLWVAFLMFLVLEYFLLLRPEIVRYSDPGQVTLAEWGIVCFSFWLFYRNLKSQVNNHLAKEMEMEDWTKLVQTIQHEIDPEHAYLADEVREFIDRGVKDGIIARLVSVMVLNGMGDGNIRRVVSRLLEYSDIPYPRIRLDRWIRKIDEENRRRRRELLKTLLDEIGQEIRSGGSSRFFKAEKLEVKMGGMG